MSDALMPTYARTEILFERGEGAYAFDSAGRRYLDFGSGIAVNALGHCHPHLIAALTAQAQKLWHTSNLYRVAGQERLAQRLCDVSFAERVFFNNSGAEAWETGVKLIRKHFHHKGQPERYRILCMGGAFHGRTMAGISASKAEKMVTGFGPLLDGFDQVAFGNLNELRAMIGPQTAAISLEPIQGEGGIRDAIALLPEIRRICDEFGLLLFLDEIQCGIGRTGRFLAHEWADIRPDVVSLAKGLGGGFPVGALLATADAAAGMGPGTHGSTFGGNPLAMAVANAVLDVVLAPGFLTEVERVGTHFGRALERLSDRHAAVEGLRGRGLMRGLKLAMGTDSAAVVTALREEGLLTVPASDNVVRLLPPLIVTTQQVDDAIQMMDAALTRLARPTTTVETAPAEAPRLKALAG